MIIPAIYCIICTENSKRYIGQTAKFYQRGPKHLNLLQRGNHPTDQLQKDYDQFGYSAFKIQILEHPDLPLLNKRELFWINHFKSDNPSYGYNKTIGGDNHGSTYKSRLTIKAIEKEINNWDRKFKLHVSRGKMAFAKKAKHNRDLMKKILSERKAK